MKKLTALLCAVFMLFQFASCSSDREGYILIDSKKVYPDEFLVLDGIPVSFGEFRYHFLNYRDMFLEDDPDYFSSETAEKELKESVIGSLLDSAAVRLIAKEKGIALTEEEEDLVIEELDNTTLAYGGGENFAEYLSKSYQTRSLYAETLKMTSLFYKVFETLFGDGGEYAWSDDKYFSYFEDNYMAVQEIFIAYRAGDTVSSHPASLAEANAVYERARSGEDFWSLIEEVGEDESMELFPKGFYFTEGQAEETLYEASKALGIGEISEPVAGKTGLYIIKRLPLERSEMEKNKKIVLFGYTDAAGEHPGAYNDEFVAVFRRRAESINIGYPDIWDKINSTNVF